MDKVKELLKGMELGEGTRRIMEGIGESKVEEPPVDCVSEIKESALKLFDLDKIVKELGNMRSADEVIHNFCNDAAKSLVVEMVTANTSRDRLSAATQILDRGLGKPVDRHMNINANIGSMSEAELDSKLIDFLMRADEDIKRIKQEGKGRAVPFFIGESGSEAGSEVDGVHTESGVSGEVFQFKVEDPAS